MSSFIVLRFLRSKLCFISPRFILHAYFSFLLIYGGLGLWGWGVQLMGFRAYGVGLSGFSEVGTLYINIK